MTQRDSICGVVLVAKGQEAQTRSANKLEQSAKQLDQSDPQDKLALTGLRSPF